MEIFRIIFAIIAMLVLVGINVYMYKRFLSKVDVLRSIKSVVKWLVVAIVIAEIAFLLTLRSGNMHSELFILFSSFIGISFMLFCVAVVYDLMHLPLQKIPFDASRRVMLKTFLDITMLIIAFSYMLKGFINGFTPPRLRKQEIKIGGLKRPLHIVQISDVHIGKSLGKEFFDDIVARINTLNADLVVITGDLIDLKASEIKDKLDGLKEIKSRYGIFFVSGNHEYFHGVEATSEHLKKLGVRVLQNENVKIEDEVNIVGVNDLMGRRMEYLEPNLKEAMQGVDETLPTILLAHQPKFVKELKDEKIDLVLSGHTHGGQIFPFGLLVLLDQPYLAGLYQHSKKTQVFVSTGAGYWGPPVRVLAPSEIVSLELTPA